MMSNYQKKPPGKTTLLGLRYANWVSLESIDGRQLSLVSAHVAPPFRDDRGNWIDLLRPSVRRVNLLVQELSSHGPVLVGGDFNVNYTSGRYPRDLLAEARLRPTYDLLGTRFPTGDHHGATIDYVFVRGKGQLQVDWHRPVELNSDHDAVVAGLSWTDVCSRARDGRAQHAHRHRPGTNRRRTDAAPASRRDPGRADRPARDRGPEPASRRPCAAEGRRERCPGAGHHPQPGADLAGAQDDAELSAPRAAGCVAVRMPVGPSGRQEQPPTLVLVRDASGAGKERIDVSRRLSTAVVTRRTSARISTSRWALDQARAAFATL